MASRLRGKVVLRGAPEYEQTRRSMVWNERKPRRFPAAIVHVADVADVSAAVRWAKASGRTVSARSGGHSWTGSSLRDESVLLNLAALNHIVIDAERRTARVGPGVRSQELDRELREHGLMFPVGHCSTVGLGGFLLGGGYGWQMHRYGQSCLSVCGVEVVDASGDRFWADATSNVDYYWAARGAGSGFFGIATEFELELRERPASIRVTTYQFPRSLRDDVIRWGWRVHDQLSASVEFLVLLRSVEELDASGAISWTPVIEATAVAFGSDDDEVTRSLAPLQECPFAEHAIAHEVARPGTMDDFYAMVDREGNPPGFRYAADNMWSDASLDDLLPELAALYDSFPTHRSTSAMWRWPKPTLPDAALSSQGDVWIGVYAIYDDPADDERCQRWVTDQMRRLEPLSVGTQLSDENLVSRFFRPMSDGNLERLEQLRARFDPTGIFESFLRPGGPS